MSITFKLSIIIAFVLLLPFILPWVCAPEIKIRNIFMDCLQKRKYYQAAKKMFKADIYCNRKNLQSIPKENLNEYIISYYSFLQNKKAAITENRYISAISGFASSSISTIENNLLDLLPKANRTLRDKIKQYHKNNISFPFNSSLFYRFNLSVSMNVCLLIIELYDRGIIKLKDGMSISDVNFADILLGNTKDLSDILADECLRKKYRKD